MVTKRESPYAVSEARIRSVSSIGGDAIAGSADENASVP